MSGRLVAARSRVEVPAGRWLAWGDAGSLVLFTVLGLRFHNIAPTPYEVLQTALPLAVVWFAGARLLSLYGRSGVWPFVLNWAVTALCGLALRQLWLGRPFGKSFLIFLAVGGTLTLVFLVAWRGIARLARLIVIRS
jgi:hypothetical protein